jgi:hypothetical protein
MAFQLAYNNTLTLDRNFFRIPAIFNSHQLVIESEDYLRLNQELVIPDVGDVYLPSTTLVNNGKSLLNLDYEYPYRLLVRARDNRSESQCEISIWYNTSQPTSSGGSSTPSTSTNSTAKTVNASATAVELLEENENRRGAIINNNSTAILLVNLASTVSPTNYTALLFSGSYYEVPYNWVGPVAGVWTEANGSASIREVF